jgi:hypothetical protein
MFNPDKIDSPLAIQSGFFDPLFLAKKMLFPILFIDRDDCQISRMKVCFFGF